VLYEPQDHPPPATGNPTGLTNQRLVRHTAQGAPRPLV
jgi:hypothetical protein